MKTKILVSACLMGHPVRYNASAKTQLGELLQRLREENRLVIHCPELAAGLPTPRPSAEIIAAQGEQVLAGQAQIFERTGADVTGHYQLAAWLALKAAQESGCRAALLTDGSPTCGSTEIYDGSFSGRKIAGNGVAAALLRQHGIAVFSHQQIPALLTWIAEQEQ
ncbi:DUF523 domain-containing protein [Scandinavium sp. V105_16]|uniref:DUF523 domain-containing protein n=1 Tax=Scandinavium lactucae TaxID=3095028 RepID=A0AAJ2VVY6_9ENTR|nr:MULTISPECIES: DUF523 domain-containing protein [unclassified Scandinavium]MDX6022576.1 DUF523 domain-containing protein [Scandinavium sp. V105_16]MDX6033582.1 DUF523 domain-containing protein [Scandinavium sp. V105_12]MDX6042566.1 DUF523 domain-containing protein [Scandinavium sp. V105_6]MDX6052567.1 DUF523 domain-containing protein [Scandinavium sp. V105_1]